jgi:tRNA (cytidine/uridine-2'-O-)-methyltransferase
MPRVILYQPEIPPNTGNVARTCAATGTELHLVEPLGFSIDDRQLKRAGLDYWPLVPLSLHRDWSALQHVRAARGGRLVALSSHGATPYNAFRFEPDDWLLFGRETQGLPTTVVGESHACLTIPMVRSSRTLPNGVRSLNLSVAVGVVLFESLRQLGLLTETETQS